jgi:hypothetical protein
VLKEGLTEILLEVAPVFQEKAWAPLAEITAVEPAHIEGLLHVTKGFDNKLTLAILELLQPLASVA